MVWQGLPFLFRQVCVEASSCCGVSVGGLAGAGAASTTSILGLGEGGEAGGAAWETAWFFRGKVSIAPEGRGGSLHSRLGQPLNQAWWLPPQLGHRAAHLFPVLSVSIHCEKGCFPLHTPQRSPVLQYFCKVKGRRERPTERHFDLPRGLSATVTRGSLSLSSRIGRRDWPRGYSETIPFDLHSTSPREMPVVVSLLRRAKEKAASSFRGLM